MSTLTRTPVSKKQGNCDACRATDVEVYSVRDMFLCEKHYLAEMAVQNEVINRIDSTIQKSRHSDQNIELKEDIWVAETVPFVELKAAIDNDESIPADQKEFEFVKECAARIKKFADVITAKEAEVLEIRNQRRSWVTQTNEYVGKLREDQRAKFKQFDISYQPKSPTIKKVKSVGEGKKQTKKGKGFDKVACRESAKKYDVPELMVQMLFTSNAGISYDEAALRAAKMLGKVK